MLLHAFVAQIEYREWQREFNRRAARGDFVRRDLELESPEPASQRSQAEAPIVEPLLEPQA
jgi:hypothetical protein